MRRYADGISRSLEALTVSDPAFEYSELLPLGPDETPYRLVTTEGVRTVEAAGAQVFRSTRP